MIKPKKLFLKVSMKKNVVGFSDKIQHQVYDKVSKDLMNTVVIYVSKKESLGALSFEDIIPRYNVSVLSGKVRFKVKEIGIVTAPPSETKLTPFVRNKGAVVDRTKRQNPVYLGLSVAHYVITAGSLGMMFTEEKSGLEVWGSNAHVLTPDACLSPEQIEEKRVCQPGSYHQEPTQATLVGDYHWHKQLTSVLSDCPVSGVFVWVLNALSSLFRRDTKLRAISSEGKNTIDFACYKPSVPHSCVLPDEMKFPGGFVGLLFAGSETAGIICKSQNISAEGYRSYITEVPVNVGDVVSGSSFWGDYTTVVKDVNLSVQVSYGSMPVMFEDLILLENDGTIKGGWSGSSFFLIDSKEVEVPDV